jgi:hypothetical protein
MHIGDRSRREEMPPSVGFIAAVRGGTSRTPHTNRVLVVHTRRGLKKKKIYSTYLLSYVSS